MAALNPAPLVQHIFLLGGGRVRAAVCSYIGAHRGEEVGSGAGILNGRSQAPILVLMLEEDFAVTGEVGLFEGGCGQCGFRVEESRELRDE